jgi:hypothetical protein
MSESTNAPQSFGSYAAELLHNLDPEVELDLTELSHIRAVSLVSIAVSLEGIKTALNYIAKNEISVNACVSGHVSTDH